MKSEMENPLILDHGPGQAIMAGFCMVAADNQSLGATVRMAAKSAADEYVSFVKSVEGGTKDGRYVRDLLMAAISFASGLTRRQQERLQRIQAAEQARAFDFKRLAQTQRLGGMLKAGVQLMILGGFAFAVVGAVFGSKWVADSNVSHTSREFAALATALGSALIGAFFRSVWIGYKTNKADKRYKAALIEAKEIYQRESQQEYLYAAQEANLAWKTFTGREPPVTDAFKILILTYLGDVHQDNIFEKADEVNVALSSKNGKSRGNRGLHVVSTA